MHQEPHIPPPQSKTTKTSHYQNNHDVLKTQHKGKGKAASIQLSDLEVSNNISVGNCIRTPLPVLQNWLR